MSTLQPYQKINLTGQQSLFLVAMVLSPSHKKSDIYIQLGTKLQQSSLTADRFNHLFLELQELQLVRKSLGKNKRDEYFYFTADGWCFALLECHRLKTFQRFLFLDKLVTYPKADYARFFAYFFHDELLWSIDEDTVEQSVNDNFHLLNRSTLLWFLPLNLDFTNDIGDYFAHTWLTLLLNAKDVSAYQQINRQLTANQKRALPIHFLRDGWLFSSSLPANHLFNQTINEEYLARRDELFLLNSHSRLCFSDLIDLYVLQNIDSSKVSYLLTDYAKLPEVINCPLGFASWFKELDFLQMSDEQLVEFFFDCDMWLKSVITDSGVNWGRLLLDLLQLCRVKSNPEVGQFLLAVAQNPLCHKIQSSPMDFNLATIAKRALRYLLNQEKSGESPFLDKPDPWRIWLKSVESTIVPESSAQDERLVWMLSEQMTLTSKIQKRNKKGWSAGRKISIDQLRYSSHDMLSDNDQMLVSFINSQGRHWLGEHPLNKPLLSLLSQSERVVNEKGQLISIVPESVLLILDQVDEKLVLQRYPAKDETNQNLLRERSEGIYTFEVIPDELEKFFVLSEQLPQVPASYAESLITLLGDKLDWYCNIDQRGSITLADWDPRPHLWLNLEEGILSITIEHQSLDGRYRMISGKGDSWLQGEARVWYQRDLKEEKYQVRELETTLGLTRSRQVHYQLMSYEIAAIFDGIQKLEDVPIHWHKSSKRIKTVNTTDLALSIKQDAEWFHVSGDVTLDGGLVLDLQKLLAAKRTGYIELEQDNVAVMINRELCHQLNLLDSVLNDSFSVDFKMAYPLQKLIECMSVDSDTSWQSLQKEWTKPIDINELALTSLRDYQHTSVTWAIRLLSNGFGACFADDMGLGKTLQALKVIEHFAHQGPSLVICPKSVLLNWQQEKERFASDLMLMDLESYADRPTVIRQACANQLILMSYGQVTRLAEVIQEIEWQTVVLDEAQQIKNPNAQRSKVLVGLNAQRRLTLSGTPVENNLVELWSQFAFLNPGLLGSLAQFKSKYGQAAKNEDDMLRLRALVSPFVVRRTKKEVLTELPEKTELIHYVDLSSKERSAYEAVRKDSLSLADSEDKNRTIKLFSALTRLRQVCCDPNLVFEGMLESSSKQKEALNLVHEALEGRHNILVFSQFVQLLKRFGSLLTQQGLTFSYLDGQSSSKQRKTAIDSFKSGQNNLFLISLKAGGTGLNLTEADTVIHLDPWWNPAVEDQASDRAYRMGQTNPVTVYRVVATNTIEEKIIQLHQEKRDLADKVLSGQADEQRVDPEFLLQLLSH